MRQPAEIVFQASLARGCDLEALPAEAKAVRLPAGQTALVGRQHQMGFFENLLGAEQQLLKFISRSHFELRPAAGKPTHFTLTNLSSNPIALGGQQVAKGEQRDVALP